MKKISNDELLTWYLEDLKLPDTTHGFRPKARNPQHWNFQSRYPTRGRPINLYEGKDIWIWSDIHLNHKNIINYSNRPYPTVDLMNKCLIGNYENVVKPGDIVIFGGDITFGGIQWVNSILHKLPGYKILVVGNHDIDRDGKYNGLEFDEIHPCLTIDLDMLKGIDGQLLVTHYPLTNIPEGCVNVHGHIHTHTLDPHNINISVEQTNYTPLHMDVVVERAKTYLEGKM